MKKQIMHSIVTIFFHSLLRMKNNYNFKIIEKEELLTLLIMQGFFCPRCL